MHIYLIYLATVEAGRMQRRSADLLDVKDSKESGILHPTCVLESELPRIYAAMRNATSAVISVGSLRSFQVARMSDRDMT